MAIPNAILTFLIATFLQSDPEGFNEDGTSMSHDTDAASDAAQKVISSFTLVMIFILYNRSRTSYNRWWEGGTLLQKTRGEWFNAYSSIMSFTSTKPELQNEVESYCHLLARLMSLLMCCGLQQVSPNRDRPFEIIDLSGIDPDSMEFLNSAPDKVEVILQWVQRSMVLHAQSGVLPVAPPILSRAFQEVSRGIVNLQNARKIADFPYPYPLAQVSMILQLLHWATIPIASSLALPRFWAVLFSFFTIFVLWCIHFNALDLEFPFGDRVNDLPMNEMQQDWNRSVVTLLHKRASQPPHFKYDRESHQDLDVVMSDLSEHYIPKIPPALNKGIAVIKVSDKNNKSQRRKSYRSLIDDQKGGEERQSVSDSNIPNLKAIEKAISKNEPNQDGSKESETTITASQEGGITATKALQRNVRVSMPNTEVVEIPPGDASTGNSTSSKAQSNLKANEATVAISTSSKAESRPNGRQEGSAVPVTIVPIETNTESTLVPTTPLSGSCRSSLSHVEPPEPLLLHSL